MKPEDRLIVALDVPDREQAENLAARVGDAAGWLKIGLELFCAAGPDIVRDFSRAGHRIMLDLKLHDIPATVGRAVSRVASLGAELLTIHTSGGRAMLEAAEAAAETARGQGHALKLLGVTVLTSLGQNDLAEIGISRPPEDLIVERTQLAMEAGIDGVVCAGTDAARLRAGVPDDFLIVTPGIRPAGADAGDQKRVTTPRDARRAGADLIVVGRPIRDASDPAAAARAITADLA